MVLVEQVNIHVAKWFAEILEWPRAECWSRQHLTDFYGEGGAPRSLALYKDELRGQVIGLELTAAHRIWLEIIALLSNTATIKPSPNSHRFKRRRNQPVARSPVSLNHTTTCSNSRSVSKFAVFQNPCRVFEICAQAGTRQQRAMARPRPDGCKAAAPILGATWQRRESPPMSRRRHRLTCIWRVLRFDWPRSIRATLLSTCCRPSNTPIKLRSSIPTAPRRQQFRP